MSLTSRLLITVDEGGRSLGVADKDECHRGDGLLHSAFLVMIFDGHSRLLQAKRSHLKKLWPHHWDGTVAGHFSPGEDQETSVIRRIQTEVGLDCRRPEYLFQFLYEARYGEVGIEKEVCHVYSVEHRSGRNIPFNPAEVTECRFLKVEELSQVIETEASGITPWFNLAFLKGKETGLF